MTKKIHKYLNKKCPECNGRLRIMEYSRVIDDMTIYDDYIECEDCDYSEDFKDKHRREKDEFGRRL